MRQLFILSVSCLMAMNIMATNKEVKTYAELKAAISSVTPGDTIYLHEGIYQIPAQITIKEPIGTEDKMIVMAGYPGEKRPVLDCEHKAQYALYIKTKYWHFKDMEVINALHNGIRLEYSENCIVENIALHDNNDTGLQIDKGSAYNIIKNCDSYHNADATNENADGFAPKMNIGTGNYFYGCRSWENADDGYDGYLRGEVRDVTTYYDHCIAYRNGYLGEDPSKGDGNGFKLGGYDNGVPRAHNFVVICCISAENRHKGFDRNSNVGSIAIYNCSAYNNGTTTADANYAFPKGKNNVQQGGHDITLKNCISYSKDDRDFMMKCTPYKEEHNSWDMGGCNTDDFKSIDANELIAARNVDGSLPNFSFMTLKESSRFIDAGDNVGLEYSGTAPDMGWKEYVEDNEKTVSETSDIKVTHEGNSINVESNRPFPHFCLYNADGLLIAENTGYRSHASIRVSDSNSYLLRIFLDGKQYVYKIK